VQPSSSRADDAACLDVGSVALTLPYSQPELDRFQQEFAKVRQRQLVVGGLAVLGLMLIVLSGRQAMSSFPLALVWVATIVGLLMFSWWNWRCPACDRYLGKYPGRSCRKCGVSLSGDSHPLP